MARSVVSVLSVLALVVVSLAVVFVHDARPAQAQEQEAAEQATARVLVACKREVLRPQPCTGPTQETTAAFVACKSNLPSRWENFVSNVKAWRDDPSQNPAQVLAWKRVLVAVGWDVGSGLAPMTSGEAGSHQSRSANLTDRQRWFETKDMLRPLHNCRPELAKQPEKPAQGAQGVQGVQAQAQAPEQNLVCEGQQADPPAKVDYDSDDDGLIEVCTTRQLNELRWDPDGDGRPGWVVWRNHIYGTVGWTSHQGWFGAFPRAAQGMGCPTTGCAGYELAADLDLSGFRIRPLSYQRDWSTTFEGNGHTIKRLSPTTHTNAWATGMFSTIASGGVVRNLTLEDMQVFSWARCSGALAGINYGTVTNVHAKAPRGVGTSGRLVDGSTRVMGCIGGLVGHNHGVIAHSSSAGQIGGPINERDVGHNVGGLVGRNDGSVRASWSSSSMYAIGVHNVGGLVGANAGSVTASYATGDLWHGNWFGISNKWHEQPKSRYMGGLVGRNLSGGEVAASYSTGRVTKGAEMGGLVGRDEGSVADSYWDTQRSGLRASAAGAGKTTAALKRPVGYTGIYASWNVDLDGDGNGDDPWHFGTPGRYPIMQTQVSADPVPVGLIGAVGNFELEAGAAKGIALWDLFSGDILAVTAVSSDEAALSATATLDALTVVGVAAASSPVTVTVTAEDASGGSVSDSFEVTVLKRHAGLIAEVYRWRNDPDHAGDKAYTDRWDRALLALGETVSDASLTPMTAAEAEALSEDVSDTRWIRLVSPLTLIERSRAEQANRAPVVLAAIGDVAIASPGGTARVALARVFVDPDSDALAITAMSSAEAVATVEVASDKSSLTVTAKAQGTATVTVTADDGNGESVADSFTVTVKSVPAVASAIADVSGLAVGDTREVSLAGVFSDADGDALTVTASSDDDGIATVTAAGDGSKLTVGGVSAGSASVTVTAEDPDGHRATDFFDVEVVAAAIVPQSSAPSRLEACAAHMPHNALTAAEVTAWRDEHPHNTAHVLRWNRVLAAFGENAPAGVTALTLAESQANERRWTPARWARVTATLQALEACPDAAQQPQDPPNQDPPNQDPPNQDPPNQDPPNQDPPNQDPPNRSRLERCAAHLPQNALSAAEVTAWRDEHPHNTAHVLRWNRVLAAFGEDVPDGVTALTLAESQANERRWTPARWARVTATLQALEACPDAAQQPQNPPNQDPPNQDPPPPANQAPTVANAIADATIVHESGAAQVSLSGVFSDPDNDALAVTAASSDTAVAAASVSSDGSALTVRARSRGTAVITVTADDKNGATVSDSFTVTVKSAPRAVSAIADVAVEAGQNRGVDIAGVFEDPDGDYLFTSADSADLAVALADIVFLGTVTVFGETPGTAVVTVVAEDLDGNQARASFTVTVTAAAVQAQTPPPNQPPEVANPIADVSGLEAGDTRDIALSGVFRDPDNDALTITAASTDENVATASVSSDKSSLTVTANAQGTVTITVTADDGNGGTASDTFEVTVTAPPPPPAEPEQPGIVAQYDANSNGRIEQAEWVRASSDFAKGKITYAQLLEIIKVYLAS